MYYFPNKTLREDATGCMRNMTAMGSLHLVRKAEQVPQGLRDLGSSKGTCPLCSYYLWKKRGDSTDNLKEGSGRSRKCADDSFFCSKMLRVVLRCHL